MNKAFRSHFKHFGKMLGKNYLFLTPSRTDRRVPSEQGAPRRTLQPDLLGSFPADVCPKITGQFGSDHSANKYHIAGTLHNKSPQTSCTVSFPATLSFQGDIIFPKCPSHQNFNCMQNRYMRSRSIGPSLQSYMTSLGSEYSSQFSTNQSIVAEFGRALLLQVTKRLICRKVCFIRLIKFQVKKQTNKQTNK